MTDAASLDRRVGLVCLILATALVAACGSPTTAAPSSWEDVSAASVLVDDPALPETFRDASDVARIDWRIKIRRHVYEDSVQCPGAMEVARVWNHEGDPLLEVDQFVCKMPSPTAAGNVMESISLEAVAGEDYWNFDYEGDEKLIPRRWSADQVVGDQAEVACAQGDANGICTVWFYRARYAQFITRIKFIAGRGGIAYTAFMDLVSSFDEAVAERASR